MPIIKILLESDLRKLVPLDLDAINCVEKAFKTLSDGHVVMPPILSMSIKEYNGEVDVKTAYVPNINSFAIKMSPGFFDNPKLGLPSTSGLMAVFSSKTGVLEALLLDNGYLTDIRTAAAGAVAARHLARPDAEVACVIGAGSQARLQLIALSLVRPLKSVIIWGRDPKRTEETAKFFSNEIGLSVSVEKNLKFAVSNADVIITSTASERPLVMADWLKPGQHITAMGSDQIHKCELEPMCIRNADLYVPDYQPQTEILGELREAIKEGLIPPNEKFADLGDIVSGKAKGRESDGFLTIADLTGTGMQDTAIATHALRKSDSFDIGSIISC